MITISPTVPPPSSAVPNHHHRRFHHILTKSTTLPIPHLKQLHTHLLKSHFQPEQAQFLYSRIIHFSSLQDLNYTWQLFKQVQEPNSFIYNTLIRAFAHSKEHKDRAFFTFQELLRNEVVLPDKHTFPFVLKACGYLFALREGEQVHGQVLKHGFGLDLYVNNSLIHFYASCGCLESARKLFDEMPERSVVSWNAIVDGLVRVGEFEESLRRFREMSEFFEADGYTLQSVIDGCAGLGALSLGMWAHGYVLRRCEVGEKFDVLIQNSLVEMYSKCGSLRMAMQVFEGMSRRDVNSWNAVILGLAAHGESESVFEYFGRMVDEDNIQPNSITFLGILSACNYRGLVDEGRRYFDVMVNTYKIKPVLQHYGCLIDLLAQSGRIGEALDVISSMPMKPDSVIWRSLIDASCKNCKGMDISQEFAKQIMADEGKATSGDYVLISRIFANAEKWDEVGLVRKLMNDKGVSKEPGCSTIEVNGIVHEFFAGDSTHPRAKEIYEFLSVIEQRLKLSGCVPDFPEATWVDEGDDRKGNTLKLHSEKLAIAFGLMNTKSFGVPIRIFKNLKICSDCHKFCKLVSKVFDVEIVMRDRVRFHHFSNGLCSCKEFW